MKVLEIRNKTGQDIDQREIGDCRAYEEVEIYCWNCHKGREGKPGDKNGIKLKSNLILCKFCGARQGD